MEQYPSDNFIPQREPNEVTLEYVAEPKPYVAYYVQDRPLPGRKPETAAQEPPAKTRRKGHRGLKIFLICLAAGCTPPGGSACCRTASTAAITATTMTIPTTIITMASLTRAPSRSCRSYRRTTACALSTRTVTATR